MQGGYNQFWTLPNYDSSSYPQNYHYSQYQSNPLNFIRSEQGLNHINYIGVGHTTSVYQNDGNNVPNNNWMANVNQMPEQIQHLQKKGTNAVDSVYLNTQFYKPPEYNLCHHYINCNNMNNDQADWISQIPPHINKNSDTQKINYNRSKQYKGIQTNIIASSSGCKTTQSPKIRVKDVSTLNRPFENYDASKSLCKTSGKKQTSSILRSLITQRNELLKTHKLSLRNGLSSRLPQHLTENNFWPTGNQYCEENVEINNTLCHCVNDDENTNQSSDQNENYFNYSGSTVSTNNKGKSSCAKQQMCTKNSQIDDRQVNHFDCEKSVSKESSGRVVSLSQSNGKQILESQQSLEVQNERESPCDPYSSSTFSHSSRIPPSVSERISCKPKQPTDQGNIVPKCEPSFDDIMSDYSSDYGTVENVESVGEKVQASKKFTDEKRTMESCNEETNPNIVKGINNTDPKKRKIIQKPTVQNSQTQTNLFEVIKDKKNKKKNKQLEENAKHPNSYQEVEAKLQKIFENGNGDCNSKNILNPSCNETEVQVRQVKNLKETKFIDIEKSKVVENKYKTEIDRNKLDLLKKFIIKDVDVDIFSVRSNKERKDCGIITSLKRKHKDDSPSFDRKKQLKESVVKMKSSSNESVTVKSQSPQKCSIDSSFIGNIKSQEDRKPQETILNQKKDDNFILVNSGIKNEKIKTTKSLESTSTSVTKDNSSKQRDLFNTKNIALKEQNKPKNKYSEIEGNEKNQSVRRDSTKENFNDLKDKSKKCESPKVVPKKSSSGSEKFKSDLHETKDVTSEKNGIFQTIKAFHKSKSHYCKNCRMNSSSDCFWVNAVSGDVKCLNCFKLEADKAKIKKVKHKEKETYYKEKGSSKHSGEEKKEDRHKVHSKSTMETKYFDKNQNEEKSCKKKSCGKTDKSALLAQLYKKTKKLSLTLLSET